MGLVAVAVHDGLNTVLFALATADLSVGLVVRGRNRVVHGGVLCVHVEHVAASVDGWAHGHHEVRVVVHLLWVSDQLLRGRVVLIHKLAVSFGHLVLLRTTASSATCVVAHCRVVVCANLAVAVTWAHHG